MLNERNPLTIMPEDFYHNTLRPELYEVLSKVKFDPVLTLTIEETINKADSSSVNKEYKQLTEDLKPLATAILSKNYQRSDNFIRADEEEKAIVRKVAKDVQDLLTIAKCTEEPQREDKKLSKERLNYDESKKENVIHESHDDSIRRERIPNIE